MKTRYIARLNSEQTAFSENKKVEHLIKYIPGNSLKWFGKSRTSGWESVDIEYNKQWSSTGEEFIPFLKRPNYVEISEETFIKLWISPDWDFTYDQQLQN